MNRASLGERIWYETSVPVFLERYLLPVAATLTVLVVFTNPMNFDWTQRITGALALIFAAYFIAHTVHKHPAKPSPAASDSAVGTLVPDGTIQPPLSPENGIPVQLGAGGPFFNFIMPEGGTIFQYGDVGLKVERSGGRLQVSTSIRNAAGKLITEVTRNDWSVRPSLAWDKNSNDQALEVIDESGNVVLQVAFMSDRLYVQGIWYNQLGNRLQLSAGRGPIQRIFAYPSALHPGELLKRP